MNIGRIEVIGNFSDSNDTNRKSLPSAIHLSQLKTKQEENKENDGYV